MSVAGVADASGRRPQIGVQASTVKATFTEHGITETFRRCAAIGYRCIEISQLPMTPENVAELRSAASETGLRITAMSAAVEPMFPGMAAECLANDYDKIVAVATTLGCSSLRIPILPVACFADPAKALEFVDRAEGYAQRLAEHGIELSYHNHHAELVRHDGLTLLEHFRRRTTLLGFELDVHWLHRGGVDPVETIGVFDGRVRLLHLKDYRIAPVRLPDGPIDPRAFLSAFYGLVEFAEIGEGTLPIARCIDAGTAAGCEFFFVEQDDTYGVDPIESLAISRRNLIALGYDWFDSP
jgi:sugar phosphate isomerase/epimerase